MINDNLNEQQLQIRARVYLHCLIAALALLVVNACLQLKEIIWADGFHQNLIIIILVFTIGCAEAIQRDIVSFKNKHHYGFIGAISIFWLFSFLSICRRLTLEESLIQNNGLSSLGSGLVMLALLSFVMLYWIIRQIIRKRKGKP